jgi:hypothetical protein
MATWSAFARHPLRRHRPGGRVGYNSHIPPENAAMATVLRDAGWSTFWVGKNHNVSVDEWTMGASKKNWPNGMGYDRFYGFIGGETNQRYPDLAEDNHYVTSHTCPNRATSCPRTSPTKRSSSPTRCPSCTGIGVGSTSAAGGS